MQTNFIYQIRRRNNENFRWIILWKYKRIRYEKNKKYKKACEKELEVYHKLKATLNEEQDKLLEELLNLNSDSGAICEKDFFIYGFKVGLHIGIESNKL